MIQRENPCLASAALDKLGKLHKFTDLRKAEAAIPYGKQADLSTKYIPDWVIVTAAIALGCGTVVGWKRIVMAVGKKIGKSHLTFAGRGWHDGGEPRRIAEGNLAQYFVGVGVDPAGVRAFWAEDGSPSDRSWSSTSRACTDGLSEQRR